MMRFRAITLGLTLIGFAFVLPTHLLAYTGEKLAKVAKVSIDEARVIALKARPGTIFRRRTGAREGWQRSSLFLRHQERRGRVRSRSGRADGQGSGKQEGRCPSRLTMRRNCGIFAAKGRTDSESLCGLHGAPKSGGRVAAVLPVTLGIPVLLGAERVCRR
jgi:hypothetical protein